MSSFKGFTLYIPSFNPQKEGCRIQLSLSLLVPLFLCMIPLSVISIGSIASLWSSAVMEYRYGIENVKRQIHLAHIKKLTKQSEAYKWAIQEIITTDRICRISYGMAPLDSGKLQAGVGGTVLASSEAIGRHESHDIVTAFRLKEQFEYYSRQTRLIHQSIERVEKRMENEQSRLRETPSILPSNGKQSSGFGYRLHPMLGRYAMHEGLDFCGAEWSPIFASADGVVVRAEYDTGGFGKVIEVRHTASGYRTRYAHLVDFNVSLGDVVKRGEQIGSMGSSGRSTGTHLHYEVLQNGNPINPERFLVGRFSAKKNDTN